MAFQGDKCILIAMNLEREVEARVAWTGEKFRRSWSWQLPCPPHRPCRACCWLPCGGAHGRRERPKSRAVTAGAALATRPQREPRSKNLSTCLINAARETAAQTGPRQSHKGASPRLALSGDPLWLCAGQDRVGAPRGDLALCAAGGEDPARCPVLWGLRSGGCPGITGRG